jgi:hypothetical protein
MFRGHGVDIDHFHPEHSFAAGRKFQAQLGLQDDDVLFSWVSQFLSSNVMGVALAIIDRSQGIV